MRDESESHEILVVEENSESSVTVGSTAKGYRRVPLLAGLVRGEEANGRTRTWLPGSWNIQIGELVYKAWEVYEAVCTRIPRRNEP